MEAAAHQAGHQHAAEAGLAISEQQARQLQQNECVTAEHQHEHGDVDGVVDRHVLAVPVKQLTPAVHDALHLVPREALVSGILGVRTRERQFLVPQNHSNPPTSVEPRASQPASLALDAA